MHRRASAERAAGGAVTQLLYDGDSLVAEYNGATLVRRYVHGPGIDEPIVWYEGSGTSDRRYLVTDHQGTVIAENGAATTRFSYGPYGEPNIWSGPRFGYTGQLALPEISLYHYKARLYDPILGRFLQTDPVGHQGGMNLYGYVGNDPLNRTDPTGLLTCSGDVQKCPTIVADAERASGVMRQVAGDLRGLRQAIRSGAELTPEQQALKGTFEGVFGEGSATAGRLGRVAGNLERGANWLDSPNTRVQFGRAGAPLNVPNSPGNTLQVNWGLYSQGSQANRTGWMIHEPGHGIGLMSDTYAVPLYPGRPFPNDQPLSLYGRNLPWFAYARGPGFVEQVPDAMRCVAAPGSGGAPAGIPCP